MVGSVLDSARVAIATASNELQAFVGERAPVEGESLVFYVLERRRLIAESACTLGLGKYTSAAACGL